MIHVSALKTEDFFAAAALDSTSSRFLHLYNYRTVGTRTQLQPKMTLHIVPEEVASVFVFQFLAGQQRKNKIIWHAKRAFLRHAGDLYSHTIFDKYSAVLLPACLAEGVLTG